MLFVNTLSEPLMRQSFKQFPNVEILVEQGQDADVVFEGDSVKVVPSGTVPLGGTGRAETHNLPYGGFVPGENQGLWDCEVGEVHGDGDEVILAVTESVMVPYDKEVVLTFLPCDNGMLVALKRGVCQLQMANDGTTEILGRGEGSTYSDDTKFRSMSESNLWMFSPRPEFKESLLTIQMTLSTKASGGYLYPASQVKFLPEGCVLLDGGFYLEEYNNRPKNEIFTRNNDTPEAQASWAEAVALSNMQERASHEKKRRASRGSRIPRVKKETKENPNKWGQSNQDILKSIGLL